MCSSALRFDDFSDVFECMHRLKHSPKDFVFLDFFNKLNGLEEKEAVNLIDQLFQLISAHGWIMTSPVVKHIQLWFSNSASKNWVGDLSAHISDRGYSCSVCNGSLPLPDMSQFQFSEMADKFYETVLKGTDVDDLFISGLSDEVVTVKRFLDSQTEPLDCIIDFLNLINLRRNFSVSGFFVAEVLRKLNRDFNLRRFCFVSKGNTILHNRRFWEVIKTLGDQLGISVHKFCTNVTSEDDAFLLYMALKSGPQCYILSQDQFTNYRFSSGPELGEKISRWQSLRQIVLLNSGPIYQKPSKCDLRVHGNVDNGWHIPYYSGELKIFHAAVNSWLCLRRLK
ncbi:unnamed protein product [Heterobilharzia americana]|nr:unnamed protein product [Heterobilharzia americana]